MINNNEQFPNENQTQSLNKMAADIHALTTDVTAIKAELAKKTNADLLSAFAQLLNSQSEQLREEFNNALQRQKEEIKVEITEMLKVNNEQLKTEFKEALKTEINNLKTEILQEFNQVKREIRNLDKRFFQTNKDVGDVAVRTYELEDRVEQIEIRLSTQS